MFVLDIFGDFSVKFISIRSGLNLSKNKMKTR